MFQSKRRMIGFAERPWANHRQYQRFTGPYIMHPAAGVFFAEESAPQTLELVATTFLLLPAPLQALSRQYGLTISFSTFDYTAGGDSSTFYADFRQKERSLISPHVEMANPSLTPELVLPHLTHEVSHLWWRNLSEEARQQYRNYLRRSCGKLTVEVTPYVQANFEQWLDVEEFPDSKPHVEQHRERDLKAWTEESFCDTVAVLHVKHHPSFQRSCTVNLQSRRDKIRSLTNLELSNC